MAIRDLLTLPHGAGHGDERVFDPRFSQGVYHVLPVFSAKETRSRARPAEGAEKSSDVQAFSTRSHRRPAAVHLTGDEVRYDVNAIDRRVERDGDNAMHAASRKNCA
jgi:hypothetical protein